MTELKTLDIPYSEGDRLPSIVGVVVDRDITGETVHVVVLTPDGVLEKTATLTDPTNGEFTIEWEAEELVQGIGQEVLIRLEDTDAKFRTLARFLIDVGEVPE